MEQNDSEIGQQSREVDITTTRVRRPCKQTMKKLVVFIASIIILVAGVLICYGYNKYKHSELKRTVPISILQSVDFPIYVPVNHTTKVDNKSFDYTNGVLQFTVQNTAEQLHFSEQKKTPEFDISKFAGGIQISGVKQLTIPAGQVVIGSINNHEITFMDTGETIVTVTGNSSSTTAESTMRSLKKL